MKKEIVNSGFRKILLIENAYRYFVEDFIFQIEIRKILANVFNSAALEEEEEASDSQRNIFGNVTSEDAKKSKTISG